MAFRIEKRTGAFLAGILLLAPPLFSQVEVFSQQDLHYQVRLRHGKAVGELVITASGITFNTLHWDYQDIQQLTVAPRSLTVLTYQNDKWRLDTDRAYRFQIASDATFNAAFQMLKTRLDQRFVAEIAEPVPNILWEIPVKRSLSLAGEQGILQIGENEIVYRTARKQDSRTWRYQDIDNISQSGPFQLTITTFERARAHYGNRKTFNFELKQRLEEARYNDLWLRLNQSQGLAVLNAGRR